MKRKPNIEKNTQCKNQKGLCFSGMLLILFIIMQYLVSVVGFSIGISISWISVILAFVSAYLLSIYFVRLPINRSLLPTLIILFSIILSSYISCFFADNSFDGNHYHQEIIVYLLNGWNPWYTYSPVENPSLWSLTYPKGIEICEATIVSLTGVMETAKVLNIILVTGTALLLYSFLRDVYPTVKAVNLVLIVIVAMLNPVVVLQLLSCLNDYVAYCLIVLTVIFTIKYCCTKDRKQLVVLLFLIVFAASVKALSFFYTGLTIFFVMLWMLYTKQYRNFVILGVTAVIGAIVAIFITSWHPYMTNWINHGNILYPLLGENTVDIMTNHIPENFRGHNRFYNWFWSLLTIDWPYQYSRAGGFGPLMWFLILSSFITTLFSLRHTKVIFYSYMATILSTLCFNEAWWARYIPQLWLVVPLGGIALLYLNTKFKTTALWGLLLCVLLTFGKGLYRYIKPTIDVYQIRKAIYEEVAPSDTVKVLNIQPSIEWHFAEHGITAIGIDTIPDSAYVIGFTEPLLNRFNACVVFEKSLPGVFRENESFKTYVLKDPNN